VQIRDFFTLFEGRVTIKVSCKELDKGKTGLSLNPNQNLV